MKPSWKLLGTTALLVVLASRSFFGSDPTHAKLMHTSTTTSKGHFHVIVTETITSKAQRDWKDAYSATVEVFKGDKSIGKFRGSTLPNFLPGKDKPAEWKYAVVQATCAFPPELKGRHYTWTRMKRADGKRPCLRLAKEVPTVNLSSARSATMKLGDLVEMLRVECRAQRYEQFAENVLVHSGQSQSWRGSAGCLTIHPDDSDKFFDLIPEGSEGTLELNRGIEDAEAKASYCY